MAHGGSKFCRDWIVKKKTCLNYVFIFFGIKGQNRQANPWWFIFVSVDSCLYIQILLPGMRR